MHANSSEMIKAREVVAAILEQLDIDAYLFEIEPRGGKWQLKVECAVDDGWSSFTLDLAERIPESDDEVAALFASCQSALASCKRAR